MKTTILKKAKRTLSLLLVLLMVVPITVSLAVPVSAEDLKYEVEGGYIYFDPSTGTITSCDQSVTKAVIPSKINGVSVTSIGENAFSGCSLLTSITIPDNVTSIGYCAFYSCESLTSVTIPDSVTSIGDYAFCCCDSLTSVTIGDSVTSIGEWAFYSCDSLTSVTIGNGVTSIGEDAFCRCTSLTSVTIPDSVTSIGEGAFSGCYSLTSITIPDSVTSIGEGAFAWCTGLTSINVDVKNESYCDIDGVLFTKDKTKLISCPGGKNGSYVIPDSVTSIGGYTFCRCTSLTSVTIPDSVTSIGDYAFYSCDKLKNVYYCGSEEEWKKIYVSVYNYDIESATITYNYSCSVVGHAGDGWITDVEASCTETGIRHRICSVCGEIENEILPVTDHHWGEWIVTTESGCGTAGEETRTCADCEAFETQVVPATGNHTYGEWIVTIEPTVFEKGVQTRKCENCDATETEEIDKLEMTNPFTDVKDGQWYTEGILWCYHSGYMAGVSETEFGRKSNVTRAMFATILAKIDGSDISGYSEMSFTDVKPNQWYSNAIEWAASNGYAAGLGGGLFGYKQNVSREQIALFFYTYSEKNGIDVSEKADLSAYADLGRVHSWALDAMEWAVAKGLIGGTSETTLSPRDSATRAEIALIVKNYVESVKN